MPVQTPKTRAWWVRTTFTARFAGTCVVCDDPYRRGVTVAALVSDGTTTVYAHRTCVTSPRPRCGRCWGAMHVPADVWSNGRWRAGGPPTCPPCEKGNTP